MAGLVPAIHALAPASKTWMRGTSPRMTAEPIERNLALAPRREAVTMDPSSSGSGGSSGAGGGCRSAASVIRDGKGGGCKHDHDASGCPSVACGLLDRIGIVGTSAGCRESLLYRQDRADGRGLRHRRGLRHLLAADRALSCQDPGRDCHRRESARRRRAHRAQSPVHGAARRFANLALQRHRRGLRGAYRSTGCAFRPREVQLPGDGRRTARDSGWWGRILPSGRSGRRSMRG